MLVLGIESSCDELAAAVLCDNKVLSSVVHSQVAIHAAYGGVVPEIASRDHVRIVGSVIHAAITQSGVPAHELDGIAVTVGPGLIGSLICGVEAAKGLAFGLDKPLVGVNHLEGHIAAVFLEADTPPGPFVALLVSGGHTSLVRVGALGGPYVVLGATRDDAAGEAFDKTAKLLGLGYPGGAAIDRLSEGGNPRAFVLPSAMPGKDNFDFSFSGLKTAALRLIEAEPRPLVGTRLQDFCASFQAAVCSNLLKKAFRAAVTRGERRLVIVGGVASNRDLRARANYRARRENVQLFLPSVVHCTDNAVMIARAGAVRLARGESDGLGLTARAQWALPTVASST